MTIWFQLYNSDRETMIQFQFTENWAIAACYLSAMEIAVNKKLKSLGLRSDAEFKEMYGKLLEELRAR